MWDERQREAEQDRGEHVDVQRDVDVGEKADLERAIRMISEGTMPAGIGLW
jgi:hypothetical protein